MVTYQKNGMSAAALSIGKMIDKELRNTQQTSILSYIEIQSNLHLTDGYKQILSALAANPEGLTDQEITKLCGYYDPNKVRPRRNELVKGGFIMEWGVKTCPVTGKKAINWKLRVDFNGK